jgi:hypothetical protein
LIILPFSEFRLYDDKAEALSKGPLLSDNKLENLLISNTSLTPKGFEFLFSNAPHSIRNIDLSNNGKLIMENYYLLAKQLQEEMYRVEQLNLENN